MDKPYYIDKADDNLGKVLIVNSHWTNRFIDIIRKENVSVLRLTRTWGQTDQDISFLENCSSLGLRGVDVYGWGVKDLTPLSHISSLESLGLQAEFNKAPDFSLLEKLRIAKLLWRPKAKTILNCLNLEQLNIMNFPSDDLSDLSGMSLLKRLQLTSRKLTSLDGIESLQSLEVLDLFSCPKLESLNGIEECPKLIDVEIESCKNIGDVSRFGELVRVQ